MGFLQIGTNNVIVDAVLTDTGRRLLSRNSREFSVVKYAAGDDEVDYTIIKKFGRTVGKEKIEKNTPVFEAITNASQAQKYKLISLSNPNLITLPQLSLNTTSNIVGIGARTQRTVSVTLTQSTADSSVIDNELVDSTFVVQMDNRFLFVTNVQPSSIDRDQRATYLLTRNANTTSLGGAQLDLSLSTKSITTQTFDLYGSISDRTVINTYVRCTGVNSGQVLEFQVQINKNT
jgi:hypothetical protein